MSDPAPTGLDADAKRIGDAGIVHQIGQADDQHDGQDGEPDLHPGVGHRLEETLGADPDQGGADLISGGGGNDILIGGSGGTDLTGANCVPIGAADTINGDAGDDILIGDNARITRDANNLVQKIETTFADHGGADSMDGGSGNDIMLGGEGPDSMIGGIGNDVMLGDNGFLTYDIVGTASVLHLISTSNPTLGCSDNIQAGDGDDIVMGGTDVRAEAAAAGDSLRRRDIRLLKGRPHPVRINSP